MKVLHILIGLVVTQLYTSVKATDLICVIKWVYFTVWKFISVKLVIKCEKKRWMVKYLIHWKSHVFLPLIWMRKIILTFKPFKTCHLLQKYVWHPFYVESKKKWLQMNWLTKQKETHRLRERNYGCWRQGVWDGHVYPVIFKMDNHQGPTV